MNRINQQIKSLPRISWGITLGISLFLGACSLSSTPNYYTLASGVTVMPSNALRVIEVLPVGLPDRLDRMQLMFQDASGQSQVLDQQRWTSTLSSELRDSLSAGLQQRLGAVDRYHSGAATALPAYRIATDFSHFDVFSSSEQSRVDVAVTWTITRVEDSQNATPNSGVTKPRQIACRMTFNTPINNSKVNTIVSASRQSLDRVANAVAASVMTLEGSAKPSDAVCS